MKSDKNILKIASLITEEEDKYEEEEESEEEESEEEGSEEEEGEQEGREEPGEGEAYEYEAAETSEEEYVDQPPTTTTMIGCSAGGCDFHDAENMACTRDDIKVDERGACLFYKSPGMEEADEERMEEEGPSDESPAYEESEYDEEYEDVPVADAPTAEVGGEEEGYEQGGEGEEEESEGGGMPPQLKKALEKGEEEGEEGEEEEEIEEGKDYAMMSAAERRREHPRGYEGKKAKRDRERAAMEEGPSEPKSLPPKPVTKPDKEGNLQEGYALEGHDFICKKCQNPMSVQDAIHYGEQCEDCSMLHSGVGSGSEEMAIRSREALVPERPDVDVDEEAAEFGLEYEVPEARHAATHRDVDEPEEDYLSSFLAPEEFEEGTTCPERTTQKVTPADNAKKVAGGRNAGEMPGQRKPGFKNIGGYRPPELEECM
jgi:hypothetical protein